MKELAPEDHVLRRYLLGSLEKEAEESVDYCLWTENPSKDESVTNRLSALEVELIDDYRHDVLTDDEKDRFRRHFLSTPERRQQFFFAPAFLRRLDAIPNPEPSPNPISRDVTDPEPLWQRLADWLFPQPVPAWALASAIMVAIMVPGLAWQFATNVGLQRQVVQMTADIDALDEQAQASQQQLAAALARGIGGEIVARLLPGQFRGQGEAREALQKVAGTSLIKLELDVGLDDYGTYRAALHDEAGDEIWSQSKLAAANVDDTVAVILTLPAELLPQGYYDVSLSGVSESGELEFIDSYYFQVSEE